jgi:hypothetical protein
MLRVEITRVPPVAEVVCRPCDDDVVRAAGIAAALIVN